jgi:hypothetical protein
LPRATSLPAEHVMGHIRLQPTSRERLSKRREKCALYLNNVSANLRNEKQERAAQLHLAITQKGAGARIATLPIMKGTYISRLYLLSSCRSLGCGLFDSAGGGCS